MAAIPTPGLSVKVATALDVISTLVAGELGYVFSVPAYHPLIIGYAMGVSFVLFKWKDEITCELLNLAAPLHNRNKYNYYDRIAAQNLKFKVLMIRNIFKKREKLKEICLFADRNFN